MHSRERNGSDISVPFTNARLQKQKEARKQAAIERSKQRQQDATYFEEIKATNEVAAQKKDELEKAKVEADKAVKVDTEDDKTDEAPKVSTKTQDPAYGCRAQEVPSIFS